MVSLYNSEKLRPFFGDEQLWGGKAWQLIKLRSFGLPVPPFLALGADLMTEILAANGRQADFRNLIDQLADTQAAHAHIASRIQTLLTELQFPETVIRQLTAELAIGELASGQSFAVRSSAIGEDGAATSFAGQMSSFLFRQGVDDILNAIKHCWASAFSERILAYRQQHQLFDQIGQVGVLVQVMVDGDVSGVMFTANPIAGYRDEYVISASYGLCEGVVSGQCDVDEFHVQYPTGEIRRECRVKTQKVVADPSSPEGVRLAAVENRFRNRPALTEEQIQELFRLGLTVAAEEKRPQDIEWTFAGGRLYLLQARPVTTLAASADPRDPLIVWDNSNIQESYCGVTLPLTFSFALRAYRDVYTTLCRVLRVPGQRMKALRPVVENMLGLVQGRVYYNINNWYRLLGILPGFNKNKADMEKMMGLEDPVDFIEDTQKTFVQKLMALPRMLLTLTVLLAKFQRMDRLVERFDEQFHAVYRGTDRHHLHHWSVPQLLNRFQAIYDQLTRGWDTPLVNDFYVMMMSGRVRRYLADLGYDEPDQMINNLLSGEKDLASVEPTKRILALADQVRADRELSQAFDDYTDQRLHQVLRTSFPDFYAAVAQFLEDFGDRSMGELKLESITMRQDPGFLYAMIRNFLAQDGWTYRDFEQREQEIRAQAEDDIERRHRDLGKHWRWWRFMKTVDKLRKAIRFREHMRFARTRCFGLVRDIFLEIGQQLAQADMLDEQRDIFYLSLAEIEAMTNGTSVQTDLKTLIAGRKKEYAGYESLDTAHHFSTRGLVYVHNSFEYDGARQIEIDPLAKVLQGTGCQSGIVEGAVRKVASPQDNLDLRGQILCAMRTDPGWTPLFPSAKGILVERGSTLSHSAVVARELGIPAVVGIPGLTKILADGDRVRMNGQTGQVEIQERVTDQSEAPTPHQETIQREVIT
jgi:pyruvate,water dikinase